MGDDREGECMCGACWTDSSIIYSRAAHSFKVILVVVRTSALNILIHTRLASFSRIDDDSCFL
jgi:hypothetical protein